jgi:hypothetical protein
MKCIKYTESYLNYFLEIRYAEQHIIIGNNVDTHNLVHLVAPSANHISPEPLSRTHHCILHQKKGQHVRNTLQLTVSSIIVL